MGAHGPDDRKYQESVARDRELKALIARIGDALEKRDSTVDEVSTMLAQLGDDLVKHFALEENGGYFADALLHAPQLISKANALLAQHPKMCMQAKDLVRELTDSRQVGESWWSRTTDLFHAFRDEIARHEKQENVLLQEAYTQDLGAND
jgi:hypothetical protein